LESRFDSGTTPSFLVFDVTGPLAYTIPITDHPMATTALPTTEYTWGIAQMERHTSDGIVIVVHYTWPPTMAPTPALRTARWP
jgi:hypothetical protein